MLLLVVVVHHRPPSRMHGSHGKARGLEAAEAGPGVKLWTETKAGRVSGRPEVTIRGCGWTKS